MRVFIAVLVLIFSLQSWTKADDISDFQIEGVSVGDSLLKFANEEKIKSSISKTNYSNDKFTIYNAEMLVEIKNYDYLTVTTKKNDKSYVITNVSGSVDYFELDDCLKKKTSIQNEIEELINFDEKEEVKYPAKQDKTGNSMIHGIQYYLKPYPSNEAILINCYHFSTEFGAQRNLSIDVNSEEFAYFLINEAHK